MPRGYKTPDHIIAFILEQFRQAPKISCRLVAERAQTNLHFKIDKATVGDYRKDFRERGLLVENPVLKTIGEGRSQQGFSGILGARRHERDLRKLITMSRDQVKAYPTSYIDVFGEYAEKPPEIPWREIEPLHWSGLKEHLEGDKVWSMLSSWRETASNFAYAMDNALNLSVESGERAFRAPFRHRGPGTRITSNFPLAVRKAILNDMGIDPQDRVYLSWTDQRELMIGGSALIACGLDMEFEVAKRCFWAVVQDVLSSQKGEAIKTQLNFLLKARDELEGRLAFLDLQVSFPGDCALCR